MMLCYLCPDNHKHEAILSVKMIGSGKEALLCGPCFINKFVPMIEEILAGLESSFENLNKMGVIDAKK